MYAKGKRVTQKPALGISRTTEQAVCERDGSAGSMCLRGNTNYTKGEI